MKAALQRGTDLILHNQSTRIGTPIYRAPEICSMRYEYYTQAIDLWGIGCTIYLLLVGKNAFNDTESLNEDIKQGKYNKNN